MGGGTQTGGASREQGRGPQGGVLTSWPLPLSGSRGLSEGRRNSTVLTHSDIFHLIKGPSKGQSIFSLFLFHHNLEPRASSGLGTRRSASGLQREGRVGPRTLSLSCLASLDSSRMFSSSSSSSSMRLSLMAGQTARVVKPAGLSQRPGTRPCFHQSRPPHTGALQDTGGRGRGGRGGHENTHRVSRLPRPGCEGLRGLRTPDLWLRGRSWL